METRLPASTSPITAVSSAPRATPTQPSVPFAQVLGQTAVVGAEAAMKVLPGGPLMAAALRGTGATGAASQALSGGGAAPQVMSSPLSAGPGAAGMANLSGSSVNVSAIGAPSVQAVSAEGPGAMAPSGQAGGVNGAAMDGALAQSQEMNMYYLRIQEQVNAQNRSFTTLSNVMKAEHETVKTAIGNIR